MSSFIPSAKHFNSIERTVIFLTQNSNFYFPYSFKDKFPKIYNGRHFSQDLIDKEVISIIDTLRELTPLCVTLQYRHHYEGKLDKEIIEQTEILKHDKKGGEPLTKIGLFKALQCLSYQIETDHLKQLRNLTTEEENALFFIDELKNTLAVDIVSSLPDYEAQKWEID